MLKAASGGKTLLTMVLENATFEGLRLGLAVKADK